MGTFSELIQLPEIIILCMFIHVERMGNVIAIHFMLPISEKSKLESLRDSSRSREVKQKPICHHWILIN